MQHLFSKTLFCISAKYFELHLITVLHRFFNYRHFFYFKVDAFLQFQRFPRETTAGLSRNVLCVKSPNKVSI